MKRWVFKDYYFIASEFIPICKEITDNFILFLRFACI